MLLLSRQLDGARRRARIAPAIFMKLCLYADIAIPDVNTGWMKQREISACSWWGVSITSHPTKQALLLGSQEIPLDIALCSLSVLDDDARLPRTILPSEDCLDFAHYLRSNFLEEDVFVGCSRTSSLPKEALELDVFVGFVFRESLHRFPEVFFEEANFWYVLEIIEDNDVPGQHPSFQNKCLDVSNVHAH